MRGILTGVGRGLRVLVATTAATALAGAGLSLAAAPAPAFSGNVVGGCWIDQISSMIAPWTTGQTLSIDGKTGGSIELQAGDTVPISYKYDLGPNNGGPDLSTVDLTVTAYVGIFSGGTQVATVSKSGPTTKGVPNSANFPGQTISTTFTAPDAGSYTAKVVLVDFFAAYPGLPLHVACTGNGTSKPAAGTAPAPTPNYFTDGPSGVNVTQRTMNFVNDPSSPFAATDFTVTSGPTTEPKKPVDVQAQPGDTNATVNWESGGSGGSPITGYTVTSDPGGKTCTTTGAKSCEVTGLTNGTSYTFTVVATNAVGDSPASDPSNAVTPKQPTAPGAPTAVTAAAGDTTATVTWVAPADDGGSVITGYTVTSAPEDKTCTTTGALTCDVTGLTNGTAYTFTVVAANAVGVGPASAASAAITPAAASASPSPSPTDDTVAPRPVAGLFCQTLTDVLPWTKGHDPETPNMTSDPEFVFAASALEVKAGDKVKLTLQYDTGPTSGPVPINAGALVPKATVNVGGDGSGQVVLKGDAFGAIAPRARVPSATLTGNYTATKDGTLSFALDTVAFDYGEAAASTTTGWPDKTDDLDTLCNLSKTSPRESPEPIGLLAEAGTAPTPNPTDNPTGGSTDTPSGGNGGTLPQTGPGEALTVLLWALVALQVGLIVVVRTRRRRARRH